MESGGVSPPLSQPQLTDPASETSFIYVFLLSLVFAGVFYGIQSLANIQDIKKNWPKYRCSPTVLPFAGLYGYDVKENFNYCMQSIFQSQMGQFTGPFGTILQSLLVTSMTFLQNLNSLRVMFSTLLGGITKMLQELTDRVKLMMSQIRVTSLRMQALMRRTFAVFYAIIYMGLSAVQTGRNFSNTFLFKFMDTFCFDGNTLIHVYGRGLVPIRTIQLGERLGESPNGPRVTSTYRFMADGQPMVEFPGTEAYPHAIRVSSNHYMFHEGTWIRADEHSDATNAPDWSGGETKPLYCLDTDTHEIPVGKYKFLDYDETEDSDALTMKWVEACVNGRTSTEADAEYSWPYQPCCAPDTKVRMKDGTLKPIGCLKIGDLLSTGFVSGVVRRHVKHSVKQTNGLITTPSTLLWSPTESVWKRAGHTAPQKETTSESSIEMVQVIVLDSSTFETEQGVFVRDFMEVHSPEAELETTKCLSDKSRKNTS